MFERFDKVPETQLALLLSIAIHDTAASADAAVRQQHPRYSSYIHDTAASVDRRHMSL